MCRETKGVRLAVQKSPSIPTVKHGGGSIKLQGWPQTTDWFMRKEDDVGIVTTSLDISMEAKAW